jgi:hypothetical protein
MIQNLTYRIEYYLEHEHNINDAFDIFIREKVTIFRKLTLFGEFKDKYNSISNL